MTVVFSTSKHLFSKVIRFVTRSKVSHASISVHLYGVPVIIESTVGGVKIYPRDKFEKENTLVYEYEVIPDVHDALQQAIEDVGEHYDYVGILGYIPVMIGRWFKKKVKNILASPTKMVCAEFVVKIDKDNKMFPKEITDAATEVTPEDLVEACNKRPEVFKPCHS